LRRRGRAFRVTRLAGHAVLRTRRGLPLPERPAAPIEHSKEAPREGDDERKTRVCLEVVRGDVDDELVELRITQAAERSFVVEEDDCSRRVR
jgi:hypothetical protein